MAEMSTEFNLTSFMRQVYKDLLLKDFRPKKIIKSADRTIVLWNDDTKTIVRCADDAEDDIYSAFTAALAEKVYGSNSQIKKILRTKVEIVPLSDRLKKKKEEAHRKLNEKLREKEESERPKKILSEYIDKDPIRSELNTFQQELDSKIDKVVKALSNSCKKEN